MKYYVDGYCFLKNPSPTGGGYTIVDQNNNVIISKNKFKKNFTNNEAELLACYEALKLAGKGDIISTDSKNTIQWIMSMKKPRKKRKRKDLDPIKKKCRELLISKRIHLIWEPRDKNLAGRYNEIAGQYYNEFGMNTYEDEYFPEELEYLISR